MTLEEFNQKLALAEGGDAQAQNYVAQAYINKQCESVEKDLAKGFEWFLKSAEQGQLNSMVNVGGWCYLYGHGTTRDCEKAVYWMERAIEAGASDEWSLNAYATALNNYGWELYDGIHNNQRFDATKDVDKAAVLFRKASETGRMSYATANLGNCYHTGQGVEKDLHKAKELYDKAVAEGLMNDVLKGWMESLDEELAKEEARMKAEEEKRRKEEERARKKAEEETLRRAEEEKRRKAEEAALRKAEEEKRRKAEEAARRKAEEESRKAEQLAKELADFEQAERTRLEAEMRANMEQYIQEEKAKLSKK